MHRKPNYCRWCLAFYMSRICRNSIVAKITRFWWLRAVQFRCNTSAKSVTPVQKVQHRCKLHIIILDYDLQKDNEKFCRPVISCKAMTRILANFVRKLWQRFSRMRKNGFKKHLPALFRARNFFMFVLLISNHTVFLVQFGINYNLWVFQKAEIVLAEAARAISAFWKTHSCKLIPNWTRKTVWLPMQIATFSKVTETILIFPIQILINMQIAGVT